MARYIEDGENENLLLVLKTYKEVKPHSSEESEDMVVEGEREISMTMMSMYIISSWGDHLQ